MSHYPFILSQGKFLHKDSLLFPYEERGLQFGDGVYEVIRIYHGDLYLLDEHVARLYRSLKAISISIEQSPQQMKQLLKTLVKKNEMTQDGYIYLQISRGSSERIHTFPEQITPNMYAYIHNQPRPFDYLDEGIKTITHRDERWKNCYIKSLNLLPNILAKQTAIEKGCYEAILVNDDGVVTECCSSNIFLVKNNTIFTHPPTKRILHGCVRDAIIRFSEKLSIQLIEEPFTKSELVEADELFLTSSISEVLPIIAVDDMQIGDGTPGKITRKLQAEYDKDAGLIL